MAANDNSETASDLLGGQPAINVRYPEQAKQALAAVIGHEPTMRLVDVTATALAAFEASDDAPGDAYLEALELAARTGIPEDEREAEAIVAENEPLPRPNDREAEPAVLLHHAIRLAVDFSGQRRVQN